MKPKRPGLAGKVLQRLARGLAPGMHRRLAALESRLEYLERLNPPLIERAARFVACEMIEGDYLEFGVYRGASFCSAYHAVTNAFRARIAQEEGGASAEQRRRRTELAQNIRFFAFDSFQGLPGLTGVDALTDDFAEGQYAAPQVEFEQALAAGGVDATRVSIVPGWFHETCHPQTWDRLGLKKAAIVWIDGDLYESARAALTGISPLIQNGTIIIFDDWFAFRGSPELGEQRAFGEWLQAMPGFRAVPFHAEGTWRNSFIMSRSGNAGSG